MDFLNTAEKRDRRMVHIPMGRFGEAIEQAKAALFRASPEAAFLVENADTLGTCSRERREQLYHGNFHRD